MMDGVWAWTWKRSARYQGREEPVLRRAEGSPAWPHSGLSEWKIQRQSAPDMCSSAGGWDFNWRLL